MLYISIQLLDCDSNCKVFHGCIYLLLYTYSVSQKGILKMKGIELHANSSYIQCIYTISVAKYNPLRYNQGFTSGIVLHLNHKSG